METIQVVLDKELLRAADRAARKMNANRSALMREALREHLRRLDIRTKEDRDREGYARRPQIGDDIRAWEAEAAWPEK
jgi:metal-responsive CopG/Arc/MetJ family transcriptional regulator